MFLLVSGDGAVVREGGRVATHVESTWNRTDQTRTEESVVVTAAELAGADYMILGQRNCSWGVSLSTLEWFENCYEQYSGRLMKEPGLGAKSMTFLAGQFVADQLSAIKATAAGPGEQFNLAGWKVLRLK